MNSRLFAGFVVLALAECLTAADGNLLRNGSFEGGFLYWHNIHEGTHRIVLDAKSGRHALEMTSGWIMCAPVELKKGSSYTISFWAKAEKSAKVDISMPPSAREPGQKNGRLWTKNAHKPVQVDTDWKRFHVTWAADVPNNGFWPNQNYMVQISGEKGVKTYIDGMTILEGKAGSSDYIPRKEIESGVNCENLTGFDRPEANCFNPGDVVQIKGFVSNPGTETRSATVRWQWIDFEGEKTIGSPVDEKITLQPGDTFEKTVPMKLVSSGCVIARVSILDAKGAVIDSSDLPVTSLPYPKASVKPDWRERFGGSFAGGVKTVKKLQRIGFGWIHWRPHANGEDHLPDKPEPGQPWKWHWFDKELDEHESHGFCSHITLYPPPKWIMGKGRPLPEDMQWQADDPRWQDLTVETVWDQFVKEVVKHYKGRPLVYEIENEPCFDKWDDKGAEYARFTIRTARLIKSVDPEAKVMVNNVYGIPSRPNSHLFKAQDGLKYVDIISWHDYHAGRLGSIEQMRKSRKELDDHGGRHVEIWFNEGWAFTNTLVDEPPACTGLTSAQSCNDIMASVAELTIMGQEKTILFHTAYDHHGMSFWDYSGPGTMLWDWYNYPLPLVAAWNVIAHHIGVSDEVGLVRPSGANLAFFEDRRNSKGVVLCYADKDAKQDVVIDLPAAGSPWLIEDVMGNRIKVDKTVTIPQSGRLVYIYTEANTPAAELMPKFEGMDRRHESLVSGGEGARSWQLPAEWDDKQGAYVKLDGRNLWMLDQIWPDVPMQNENYRPMTWNGSGWNVAKDGFGGQPGVNRKGRSIIFGTRAAHGEKEKKRRTAALSFAAPEKGVYTLKGDLHSRIWDGKNDTKLYLLKRGSGVEKVAEVTVKHEGTGTLDGLSVELEKGEMLTLVPMIEGMFAGGSLTITDLQVALGGGGEGRSFRLPGAWEDGQGNPLLSEGKPLWRLDRVYPSEFEFVANYQVMPWSGSSWQPADHTQGGQPRAVVDSDKVIFSVAGPWTKHEFQKTAALVFIAPEGGTYRVSARVSAKKWTGGAEDCTLSLRKKDTQRSAEIESVRIPFGDDAVEIDMAVDLSAGHELVILPLMPHWNNGLNLTLENLRVFLQR